MMQHLQVPEALHESGLHGIRHYLCLFFLADKKPPRIGLSLCDSLIFVRVSVDHIGEGLRLRTIPEIVEFLLDDLGDFARLAREKIEIPFARCRERRLRQIRRAHNDSAELLRAEDVALGVKAVSGILFRAVHAHVQILEREELSQGFRLREAQIVRREEPAFDAPSFERRERRNQGHDAAHRDEGNADREGVAPLKRLFDFVQHFDAAVSVIEDERGAAFERRFCAAVNERRDLSLLMETGIRLPQSIFPFRAA